MPQTCSLGNTLISGGKVHRYTNEDGVGRYVQTDESPNKVLEASFDGIIQNWTGGSNSWWDRLLRDGPFGRETGYALDRWARDEGGFHHEFAKLINEFNPVYRVSNAGHSIGTGETITGEDAGWEDYIPAAGGGWIKRGKKYKKLLIKLMMSASKPRTQEKWMLMRLKNYLIRGKIGIKVQQKRIFLNNLRRNLREIVMRISMLIKPQKKYF